VKRLVLTELAESDIEDIGRYTEERWGKKQKRRYLGAIQKRLSSLRRRPRIGAPRTDIAADYRSAAVGQHFIFYRELDDRLLVLRILHVSMDHVLHLGI
jgi:toxin ParE1/3/4